MKVLDSLDNVPNENVVTQLVTDQQTDRLTDQLLELLEWLFATKKCKETNILHGRTTLKTRSYFTKVSSNYKLVTGVARVINIWGRFPGGRDVVDLHEGGDDLILPGDG